MAAADHSIWVIGQHGGEPLPLVAGPGVWICGSCAQTAIEILSAEPRGLRAG